MKSGWAVAVLLAGPVSAPRVIDRRRIELSDPGEPATAQPYHAGFGTGQTDTAAVRRLTGIVRRCARSSFAVLVRSYHEMGHHPERIGLVVGSTIDPAAIANQHIRAHAQEGRLFRTVLEANATRHRIRPRVVLERELYAIASRELGLSLPRLRRVATALGKGVGRPWRREDKAATVAAWLVLAARR